MLTTNEVCDKLDEADGLIAEAVSDGRMALDAGQILMLGEAQARLHQTLKELRTFDPLVVSDALDREYEDEQELLDG